MLSGMERYASKIIVKFFWARWFWYPDSIYLSSKSYGQTTTL